VRIIRALNEQRIAAIPESTRQRYGLAAERATGD
jgi:hypothetical protein